MKAVIPFLFEKTEVILMPTENYEKIFEKRLSFWNKMSESEKQFLCDNAVNAGYKKGMRVHSGEDDCIGVLLVNKGQLRVYMLSEDGKEITLYRLYDNDICVLSASCIFETITFDVFIDAEEDTELVLINSAVYKKLASENIYIECFGYKTVTSRFSEVMWAMQQILFMSFDRRLAIFITDELAKSGSDKLDMTHEQIAKYMGSAREVVSRMLKYFANEGIVELYRGGVRVLDKKRLRALT